MSRFKKILKWSLISVAGLALLLFAFGYWFSNLIPEPDAAIKQTVAQSLPYLSENKIAGRGKILAVVTSTETMGTSGKATGYELTELSRAYYVFQANGFEVDVASPQGGQPPVVIDGDDMGVYDYAFLNDPVAQQKTKNTLAMAEVDPALYNAVYFVGGKGAMYDFPGNAHIQSLVSSFHESGKVIGAVCHGPAALIHVKLANGKNLLEGKPVSGFTNKEELFLIPDAESIFPFLLEEKLIEQGAKFKEGTMYLENVVHDRNLITGQNPWSTWKLAETMVSQMGYQPKKRVITSEENAIEVLGTYKQKITDLAARSLEIDRRLLVMHSVVEAMQLKLASTCKLIWLLKHAKNRVN